MSKYTEDDLKIELENKEYEYGFYTDLDSETFPIGLNEDIVRAISLKKQEPKWMTDWRIEAFRAWQEMTEPDWANVHYEKPDFQAISYYSAPKKADPNKTLDDVDPDLLEMYKKLGISIDEQKKMNNIAMDIVVDSVSVATTFKKTLAEKGIIFMSISENCVRYPALYSSDAPSQHSLPQCRRYMAWQRLAVYRMFCCESWGRGLQADAVVCSPPA